jgi:hypothetical protein
MSTSTVGVKRSLSVGAGSAFVRSKKARDIKSWTDESLEKLINKTECYGIIHYGDEDVSWAEIASFFPDRSADECREKYQTMSDTEADKYRFSIDEDVSKKILFVYQYRWQWKIKKTIESASLIEDRDFSILHDTYHDFVRISQEIARIFEKAISPVKIKNYIIEHPIGIKIENQRDRAISAIIKLKWDKEQKMQDERCLKSPLLSGVLEWE